MNGKRGDEDQVGERLRPAYGVIESKETTVGMAEQCESGEAEALGQIVRVARPRGVRVIRLAGALRLAVSPLIGNDHPNAVLRDVKNAGNAESAGIDAHAAVQAQQWQAATAV